MYAYQIYFNEEGFPYLDLYLVNNEKYTNEEFQDMCKEASKSSIGGDSVLNILDHLTSKYGFKNINDLRVASYEGNRTGK